MFRSTLDFPLCTACQRALSPIADRERCSVCSIPLISELDRCSRCSERDFSFESNFSIYEYQGPVRQVISQFKFSNRRSLASFLARLFHPSLESRYPGLPLVPVPGNRRSVRRRGWDPMHEVARVLRKEFGMTVLFPFRRRRGGPQKGLHYQQRLENIRGTVMLNGKAGKLPERVVLIDDIFTSGATADECARVLREAGAGEVYVVTLALET
jgi:ComF family protein